MAYVDLGEEKGRYTIDWDRLGVWYPQPEDRRAFTVPDFVRSVEREVAHQNVSNRMRKWMQRKGNAIVIGAFEGRLGEL